MGKVQVIQKSRKECKCNKCGKIIPVGSKYYKGEINFGPTIRRCESCKLEGWEVTTSAYQLQVGRIVYKWEEDYAIDADGVSNIISDLEEIRDEVQERLDNMPYQLQEADTGMILQERIDALDSAISELESIDVEVIQEDKLSSFVSDFDFEDSDCKVKEEDLADWDSAETALTEAGLGDEWIELEGQVEEEIKDSIESALSELDV